MYRYFVLLVNLAVLGYIIFMTFIEPPNWGKDYAEVGAIYLFVIINITYAIFSKTEKESWITLYFRRKALEEKKKIQTLKKEL